MEWIDAKKELPKEEGWYITAYHPKFGDVVYQDQTSVDTTYFRGKTCWGKKHREIIGWQPLPKYDEVEVEPEDKEDFDIDTFEESFDEYNERAEFKDHVYARAFRMYYYNRLARDRINSGRQNYQKQTVYDVCIMTINDLVSDITGDSCFQVGARLARMYQRRRELSKAKDKKDLAEAIDRLRPDWPRES